MSTSKIRCEECGEESSKENREINRSKKLGRALYCGQRCAAIAGNRPRKSVEVVKVCPFCKKQFVSTTHNKAASFCSTSCASRGSVTETRRLGNRKGGFASVGNLISPSETLKKREAWKYAALEKFLRERGDDFEFEYNLDVYIFDLAFPTRKILVEFDGPDHHNETQQLLDAEKNRIAQVNGFILVRRPVSSVSVIDPHTVRGLWESEG